MGETIERMRQQITEFWQNMDKKKKIQLGIITLLVLGIITFSIIKLTSTNYSVLYSDLSLKDMGQITAKLDEMGIGWKTGSDQKSILVPEESNSKAKIELATQGLPKDGYSFMDAFKDSSWTMTDYDKKQRMKMALQSELSSTIAAIEGIQSAEIYIEEKDATNFILDNSDKKATASVFIVKDNMKPITKDNVKAIKNLVAGAISMDPSNVTVIDDEGKLLDIEDEDSFNIGDPLIIKQSIETRLNEGIKKFLTNVYGPENVDVMSSVKINMDAEHTQIKTFDTPLEGSEEGIMRSLEEMEEHMTGGVIGGEVGQVVNPQDPEDYAMLDENRDKYDKISKIVNYEMNEINKEIRKAPGQVENITVAVLINKDSLPDGEMTPEKEKEISDLVFAATGLDTKQVRVIAEKFNKGTGVGTDSGQVAEETKGTNWMLVGILGALLLGLVLFLVFKNKKQKEQEELERLLYEEERRAFEITDNDIEDIAFEEEESKMKAQINKFVDKKPDAVAQLLRNWLNE